MEEERGLCSTSRENMNGMTLMRVDKGWEKIMSLDLISKSREAGALILEVGGSGEQAK